MSFNPNQPRNKDGEWTDAGGGGPHDAKTLGVNITNGPEGYIYHATGLEHLRQIAKRGLIPHFPPREAGLSSWSDGVTEKRSYFLDGAIPGSNYAHGLGRPVVVRAKQSDVALSVQNDGYNTGYYFTKQSIPANKLEYLAADGNWYPVTKTKIEKHKPHTGAGRSGGSYTGIGGGAETFGGRKR